MILFYISTRNFFYL